MGWIQTSGLHAGLEFDCYMHTSTCTPSPSHTHTHARAETHTHTHGHGCTYPGLAGTYQGSRAPYLEPQSTDNLNHWRGPTHSSGPPSPEPARPTHHRRVERENERKPERLKSGGGIKRRARQPRIGTREKETQLTSSSLDISGCVYFSLTGSSGTVLQPTIRLETRLPVETERYSASRFVCWLLGKSFCGANCILSSGKKFGCGFVLSHPPSPPGIGEPVVIARLVAVFPQLLPRAEHGYTTVCSLVS